MTHGLQDNVSVLRRWAAHSGSQLPTNWRQFETQNFTEAQRIRQVDPDLVALLQGTASAGLRADALTGKFSQVPPDYEQQQRQAAFDRQQELIKKVRAGEANLTERIECEQVAPAEYAREMAKHQPSAEQRHAMRLQQARQQQELLQESKARANAQLRNQARARGLW